MIKQIVAFFLILSGCAFGQTKIDSLVFEKINGLRIAKKLQPISWDPQSWQKAHKHSVYLIDLNRFSTKDNFTVHQMSDTIVNKCTILYKEQSETEFVKCVDSIVLHLLTSSKDSILDKKIKSGSVSCSQFDINAGFINFVAK